MKTIATILATASAASMLSLGAFAQDEEGSEANVENSETEVAGIKIADIPKKTPERLFHVLPYCRMLEGKGEVYRPGASEWAPIEEGKYYPLGTLYRTKGSDSRLRIMFGNEAEVDIEGEASFGTRALPLAEKRRVITLVGGTITVKLPRNLPEGMFVVSAPGFKVVNPAGDSRYTYSKTGDGDEARIRCVTGSLTVEGRHFKVLSMRAANEIRITTSQDMLFTGLYGSRGDVVTRLDQGRVLVKDFETGENKIEDKVLDWKLSPLTAVRIHRAMPALGEKMAVTVMTFEASGELKNRCAFTEKTVEVNSGELGPTSKKDRENLEKQAAEATETVAAEAPAEESPADSSASADSSDEL
ncbi:MAG: hypothetical protein IJI73_08260 [Kiritimatiellae bacterium]|nr:hypothetical protein [Kiritimatiellia bacterium]